MVALITKYNLTDLYTVCFRFSGDCEMALCGGVNCIIQPLVFVALSKAKMISPEGTSKPFSSKADGYGRGEGCGILLLKPLKQVSAYDFFHLHSLQYSSNIFKLGKHLASQAIKLCLGVFDK